MKGKLFISDLHLTPERSGIVYLFNRFINNIAAKCESLYILGDFLEYWVGDDSPVSGLETVIESLSNLSQNTSIYLMHGNRDFLIGNKFCKSCGCKLIEDGTIIDLHGTDALLMHGDTLCTDDTEYQEFRGMVRDSRWQQDFLSQTLDKRIEIANSMRETSQKATNHKLPVIMDVNLDAVNEAFTNNNTRLIIHGHTHRPAIHEHIDNQRSSKRIVLGDWYHKGSYLLVDKPGEYELRVYE